MQAKSHSEKSLERAAHNYLKRHRAKRIFISAKPLSYSVGKCLDPKIMTSAAPFTKLRMHWQKIVGLQLAKWSEAVSLTGRKSTTLVLSVSPMAAPLIQHQWPVIKMRIKLATGIDITRYKLQQTFNSVANSKKEQGTKLSRDKVEDAVEKEHILAELTAIESAELKMALLGLGMAVNRKYVP